MRTTRARLVALAAIAAAVLVAWLYWRGHRPARLSDGGQAANGHGSAPLTGTPGARSGVHWLASGQAGKHIAGVVVGEDGAPIAGAIVRLASQLTSAGVAAPAAKPTDATGHFDLGAQPAMPYVVSAEAPKTTAAIANVDLREPDAQPPPDQLRLVLHACTASIHGTVYDTTEGAIRGAIVARQGPGWPTQVAVEADDRGEYELCVPVGETAVIVSAEGYAPHAEGVDVYGRTRRDFRLVPGAPLAGRVIRADDKSPVGGALVEVRGADPRAGEPTQTAQSSDDGTFHFDAVAPGKHQVSAEAERLATGEPVEAVVELGAPNEDTVCELVVAPTLSGKVVDKGTKKPVAGERVFLIPPDERMGRRMRGGRFTQSRGDGSFAYERLVPGDYSLTAGMADDRAGPRKVTIAREDVADVVIEVEAGATVEGRVLSAGKPVDGANVRVGVRSETSDAEGHYRIVGIPAGTHELYAESKRVGAFARGKQVAVAGGEHKTGVDIELDLAGSISGVVVDQNDAPVAGAFVRFSLLHGEDFGSATTADDGSFTARALSGGGDYLFEVRQNERSPLAYPPVSGKHHPPVAVADGTAHVTGVRVKVRVEKLAIVGRVVDAAGKPVADARVNASPREMGWYRSLNGTTDEGGAFTIRDLETGVYRLQATSTHAEGTVEGIAAGAKNVTITLLSPGGIDGTLEGFSKPPRVTALLMSNQNFRAFDAKVTGSTFQLRDLPPGHYQVQARAGTERAALGVDIVATQIKAITLAAGQVGSVVGTVVDGKTKAPIAGLHCRASVANRDEFDPDAAGPTTDAAGAFRIERVPVGDVVVVCMGKDTSAWGRTTVSPGQAATVAIVADTRPEEERRRNAGLTLENQLGEVLVESVAAGGPAAKAGIQVGDEVISVNSRQIDRGGAGFAMMLIERDDKGEPKLVLERADKQITVTLKLDP